MGGAVGIAAIVVNNVNEKKKQIKRDDIPFPYDIHIAYIDAVGDWGRNSIDIAYTHV